MCGITGFTFPAGGGAGAARHESAERLRRMTASIKHRGPDAQRALVLDGVALGHTRLSIVDLEGTAVDVTYLAEDLSDAETDVTTASGAFLFQPADIVEIAPELAGSTFLPASQPVGSTANVAFQVFFLEQ